MAISGISTSNQIYIQRSDPTKLASDLFAKIDTKNQGYIDKAELQTAFDQISTDGQGSASDLDNFVSSVDADGDGKITKQELTDSFKQVSDALNAQFDASRISYAEAPSPPSVDEIFSSLDTKNQGYLDKEELQAAFDQQSGSSIDNGDKVDQIFKTLDTDGDNKITKEELSAGIDRLGDQQDAAAQASNDVSQLASAGPAGSPPPRGAKGGGGAEESTSDDPYQIYETADTNQDGTVSLQELIAYQMTQTTQDSSTETDSQNSLEAMLRIAKQLEQAYGQYEQGSNDATSNTAIAEVA